MLKKQIKHIFMKRTFTLVTLLLFVGMMLPSCGITIVKRQHTGGYYINTNPRQHVDKGEAANITKDENKQIASNQSTAEAEELTVKETPATVNEQTNTLDAPTTEQQTDGTPVASTKASSTERKFSLSSMAEKVPMMKKVDSKLKKVKSNSGSPRSDDGLSLIWIVILVLLILWALGLLGGGWGLGGLINILLVIALILLILWLLRVI